jgi:general secretion pathway protein J
MSQRRNGFTLVELLVVMTMLGMLMVAMASALRTTAQTENRVDQRLERMDDMRVATHFMRQILGRVSLRKMPTPDAKGGQVVPFRATESAIEWLGIMPVRNGAGGRTYFKLQLQGGQGRASLVLYMLPWSVVTPSFPDWSLAQTRTLVTDVQSFSVLAQGDPPPGQLSNPAWPKAWVSGWPVPDELPERILLRLSSRHGTWPDLVIPVVGLTQGIGSSGGFVLGGSSR